MIIWICCVFFQVPKLKTFEINSKENDRREWLKSVWDEYPETHEIIRQETGELKEEFDHKIFELLCKYEFSDDFKKHLSEKIQQQPKDLWNISNQYEWLKSIWDEYPETHTTILQEAGFINVCNFEFSDDFKNRLNEKIRQIRSAKKEDSIPYEHRSKIYLWWSNFTWIR